MTAEANTKLAWGITAQRTAEPGDKRLIQSVSSAQERRQAKGTALLPPARPPSRHARPTWHVWKSCQSYEKVYAPFDGVITARNTDVGNLINAGARHSKDSELFHMTATDTLRIYVSVPEAYAPAIQIGATPQR